MGLEDETVCIAQQSPQVGGFIRDVIGDGIVVEFNAGLYNQRDDTRPSVFEARGSKDLTMNLKCPLRVFARRFLKSGK